MRFNCAECLRALPDHWPACPRVQVEKATRARNLARVADDVRAIADEIESGRWDAVDLRLLNDLRDKPRFSWQDFQGKDLVGVDIYIRLALPNKL